MQKVDYSIVKPQKGAEYKVIPGDCPPTDRARTRARFKGDGYKLSKAKVVAGYGETEVWSKGEKKAKK